MNVVGGQESYYVTIDITWPMDITFATNKVLRAFQSEALLSIPSISKVGYGRFTWRKSNMSFIEVDVRITQLSGPHNKGFSNSLWKTKDWWYDVLFGNCCFLFRDYYKDHRTTFMLFIHEYNMFTTCFNKNIDSIDQFIVSFQH